jgi:NAD(P)H dehydrogenase (quinone)
MSIVVARATGHLGRLVVERLVDRGLAPDEIVAAGRSLDRVADLAGRGVRTAVFDHDAPADGVLEAGDTFLLTSMPVPGNSSGRCRRRSTWRSSPAPGWTR